MYFINQDFHPFYSTCFKVELEFHRVFFEFDSFLHSMAFGFYGVGGFFGLEIVVLDVVVFVPDGFQVHFAGEAGIEDVVKAGL